MTKAADAFRTISEVADDLEIPKHVLRFWEVKFAQIRPMKRGGGRRYYRPEDLELLKAIRLLLHRDGYTIKGVQKILREQGVEAVKARLGTAAAVDAVAAPVAVAAKDSVGAGSRVGARRRREGTREASAAGSPSAIDPIAAAIAELERCRALLQGDFASPAGAAR
jgi:DNA-binding transcriptional MerR regulator